MVKIILAPPTANPASLAWDTSKNIYTAKPYGSFLLNTKSFPKANLPTPSASYVAGW